MEAFKTLVDADTSLPILSIPERGLRYSIDTDAIRYQVGCALFQTHHDGKRSPIWFWPRKMAPAEMNYSVSEQECLAVIHGITTSRLHLLEEEFDFQTDHNCL